MPFILPFTNGYFVTPSEEEGESDDEDSSSTKPTLVKTEFPEWCASYFALSVMKPPEEHDPQSQLHLEREWRFERNSKVRREAAKQQARADDGSVRLYRNYSGEDDKKVEMVTAWQALSGMLPSTRGSGSGLVVNWEQETGILLASGDVRFIRVWDTQREMKMQDIPTGADSCVTSLACDSVGRSLLIAGCGDGSVRLYDRRLPPSDSRVMALREHSGWVTSVFLQKGGDGNIISGSVAGDVRFWDPRFSESVKHFETLANMTAFEVHHQAKVIASGSANQMIRVYDLDGNYRSVIRYHDGFMGQRIGPITCMAFHPHRVNLAAGSTDAFISIYSSEKKVR
ncbi:Regulatory-associated protein of mTOR [Exaiptasia diaphana]|nr:Regulatory-associated protein of mTOR [Exaiptasia diaphana]